MNRFFFILSVLFCSSALLHAKVQPQNNFYPQTLPPENEIADRNEREKDYFNLYYKNQRRMDKPNFGAGTYYFSENPQGYGYSNDYYYYQQGQGQGYPQNPNYYYNQNPNYGWQQ